MLIERSEVMSTRSSFTWRRSFTPPNYLVSPEIPATMNDVRMTPTILCR